MAEEIYPRFRISSSRGIIPDMRLPQNYRDLLPRFYEAGGKRRVEEYAADIARCTRGAFGEAEARLGWGERGLEHISCSPSSGLDLEGDEFREHNLGGTISLITGAIAMEYIALLQNPYTR